MVGVKGDNSVVVVNNFGMLQKMLHEGKDNVPTWDEDQHCSRKLEGSGTVADNDVRNSHHSSLAFSLLNITVGTRHDKTHSDPPWLDADCFSESTLASGHVVIQDVLVDLSGLTIFQILFCFSW